MSQENNNSAVQVPATNSQANNAAQAHAAPEVKEVKIGVYEGRYAPSQKEMFTKSQVYFGLSEQLAHKAATVYGSDLGRLKVPVKVTVGKPKGEDLKCTVKESGSMKGVIFSYSLQMARLILLCDEIAELKADPSVALSDEVIEWLNK